MTIDSEQNSIVFANHSNDSETPQKIVQDPQTKPLIGIEPQHIWKQKRAFALVEAIARYSTGRVPVKNEWLQELGEILAELFPANAKSSQPSQKNDHE